MTLERRGHTGRVLARAAVWLAVAVTCLCGGGGEASAATAGAATATGTPVKPPPATAPAALSADEWFVKGSIHYKLGEYGAALAAYQEARRLRPHPVHLYNLALVYRALGRLAEARAHYKKLLEEDPATPLRPEAEAQIAELDAALARGLGVGPPETSGAAAAVGAAGTGAGRAGGAGGGRKWGLIAIAGGAFAAVVAGVVIGIAVGVRRWADTELGRTDLMQP